MARCVPLAEDKAQRDRYADDAIAMYRAAIAAALPNWNDTTGDPDPFP